ncbi:hypothetical protein QBC45DRAFT_288242, partial [Copromyces sp. CBS 386.78]
PQQQPQDDLSVNEYPAKGFPGSNRDEADGSISDERESDEEPSDEEQSDESDVEQSDEDQSDEELAQDWQDESPEPEEPHALGLLPQPAAIQNAHLRMCQVPGCDQPTLAQTRRSYRCRDHLDNPPPRSREAALNEAVAAGHGYCTGCNGLRPRRAPGRNCWECLCKNRRQRFGVCDGCPASWCPNRDV